MSRVTLVTTKTMMDPCSPYGIDLIVPKSGFIDRIYQSDQTRFIDHGRACFIWCRCGLHTAMLDDFLCFLESVRTY